MKKQKIKVTIVFEVSAGYADDALHVLDNALDWGSAQESLLDSLSEAGIKATSASALVDYDRSK